MTSKALWLRSVRDTPERQDPRYVRERGAAAESYYSAAVIIPAPTVALVASSIRMKLPVWRLRR